MPAGAEADPLVIRSITFMGGLAASGGFEPPEHLPQIAFAGRSNSGKSSLINALTRRRTMARVSRTPGRTREINFFNINDQFVLADLPGYGYAKASETTRREMRYLVDRYLRGSRALRGLVVLMDVRRVPSKDDERMLDLVAELEIPVLIAVTKVDKLSATRAREHAKRIREHLQLEDDQIVPFSAVTGAGRDELAAAVIQIVTGPPRTLTP